MFFTPVSFFVYFDSRKEIDSRKERGEQNNKTTNIKHEGHMNGSTERGRINTGLPTLKATRSRSDPVSMQEYVYIHKCPMRVCTRTAPGAP